MSPVLYAWNSAGYRKYRVKASQSKQKAMSIKSKKGKRALRAISIECYWVHKITITTLRKESDDQGKPKSRSFQDNKNWKEYFRICKINISQNELGSSPQICCTSGSSQVSPSFQLLRRENLRLIVDSSLSLILYPTHQKGCCLCLQNISTNCQLFTHLCSSKLLSSLTCNRVVASLAASNCANLYSSFLTKHSHYCFQNKSDHGSRLQWPPISRRVKASLNMV